MEGGLVGVPDISDHILYYQYYLSAMDDGKNEIPIRSFSDVGERIYESKLSVINIMYYVYYNTLLSIALLIHVRTHIEAVATLPVLSTIYR